MAQFWTEDPSIGNALAGLADSFSGSKAVAMANTIEDIKKKRAQAAAAQAAIQANQQVWMNRPPPEAPAMTPDAKPFVSSGGAPGTEVVPAGGPLPLKTYSAPATQGAQQASDAEFQRVRARQLAEYGLGAQHATSWGDVATNAPKAEAMTSLDLYGVPKTVEAQNKMQTQLTGQLPMLDVKGTTNNWTDPATGRSGQTRDGRTDLNTGQPLPAGALKMGEVSADQSPYKDQGAQLTELNKLTQKVVIGQPLSVDEKQRANILVSTLYPNVQKVEKDSAGGIRVVGYNEKVVSPGFAPLIAHLNQGIAPAAPPPGPPQPTALPPNPAMAAGPGQRATVPDALASSGPAPTAAPAAADAKPIVPPGALSATGVSVSAPIVQGAGDEQLKEILNHPTVKGAMDAGRAYNEMVKANQDNTPESALHMIYMLAKIYDPNSVVREGEVATAQNTSPAAEKWWGLYQKQLNAQSPLSERAKASFLEEGYKAAQAHYDQAKGLVDYAGERATRLGLDPQNVMPPLSAPQRAGAAPAKAAAPARAGGGQTVILDGKRYTKNPDGSYSGPN